MPLQLLHSEFPYIWGKFDFSFISVERCYRSDYLMPPSLRPSHSPSRVFNGSLGVIFHKTCRHQNEYISGNIEGNRFLKVLKCSRQYLCHNPVFPEVLWVLNLYFSQSVRRREYWMIFRGTGFLVFSRSYDLASPPPHSSVSKLDQRLRKRDYLLTGEGGGGGGGAKSYDLKKAWSSINL